MRIDNINNTGFTSYSLAVNKAKMISKTKPVPNVIKTYAQYLKEYGLKPVKKGKV